MRLIACSLFLLLPVISLAQLKDLSTLPVYDCSLKKVMAIIGRQTVLVSPDKSVGLETIVNDYCSAIGNNCIRKKEGELTGADFSKDLFLIGVLTDFKKWNKYGVPVTAIEKGFLINGKKFQNSSDGFVYVDTNRIIIGGNSLTAVKNAQAAFTGGHDVLITRQGKITYFGNREQGRMTWFNLQNLKATNYNQKTSGLFSAIYVSKTFSDTINYRKLNSDLKSYAQQFLSVYKLKMPAKNVDWFIHSTMNEYGTMSGMFGLTCPGNNSAGFSIRGEIHTNGFNTELVKHEYSHFLFDNAIAQDNNPAFFVEGCVEYVTNLNDTALFEKRVAVAKTYKDTLNYTDLIVNNKDFYGQYSEANYSICGIFVKYIVDNFGVVAFKDYCLSSDKKGRAKVIFKKDFAELVDDYKRWLGQQ